MSYDDAERDHLSHGRPTTLVRQNRRPLLLIETDYVDREPPAWVIESRQRALRSEGWVMPRHQLKETGNLLGHRYRMEWWGSRD